MGTKQSKSRWVRARWTWLAVVGVAAFVGTSAAPPRACAQATGDVGAAADAFSRAQQAELRQDWAEAAQLYSLADRIAPAAVALRSAASAALRAGMNATAATLAAELLARDGTDRDSRAVAERILRETEDTLGRIHVRCEAACRVLVDGRLATSHPGEDHVVYVRPGTHRVGASFDGAEAPDAEVVPIVAGARVDVALAPRAVAATSSLADEDPAPRRGATPWIFATGVALTVGAGALSIWSGTKVVQAHDAYDRSAPDAPARYADGRDLERRTNVLLATTGGLALGTIVIAAFTNWHGSGDTRDAARLGHPVVVADANGVVLGWSRPMR